MLKVCFSLGCPLPFFCFYRTFPSVGVVYLCGSFFFHFLRCFPSVCRVCYLARCSFSNVFLLFLSPPLGRTEAKERLTSYLLALLSILCCPVLFFFCFLFGFPFFTIFFFLRSFSCLMLPAALGLLLFGPDFLFSVFASRFIRFGALISPFLYSFSFLLPIGSLLCFRIPLSLSFSLSSMVHLKFIFFSFVLSCFSIRRCVFLSFAGLCFLEASLKVQIAMV